MSDARVQIDEALLSSVLAEIKVIDHRASQLIAHSLPKGMELSHFVLLNHFYGQPREKMPAELAKALNVTRGAMTNTIHRLEAKGYLYLRPDWDDARKKWVSMTPAGKQARDQAMRQITPELQKQLEDFGEDKLRTLLPLLRELRQMLD